MSLSNRDPISLFCEHRNVSKAELASLVGVSPQLLSEFAAGRCGLSDRVKIALARVSEGHITIENLINWVQPD